MERLQNHKNKLYILVAFLMTGPFYLNDFSNILIKDWHWWLFIDYTAVKLFPLGVVFFLIYSGKMKPSEFGFKSQSVLAFLVTFLVVTLVGTLIDQNGRQLIAKLPGYPQLGGMPEILDPVWNWIDLTFGLLMVGMCEEFVFRGFLCTFISRCTKNSFAIIILSSVAFGLIHWSLGLHEVIVTSTIGAVFMISYLRTRSVWALFMAHFMINFIDFAGVIPKTIFKITE
jgi:membrane protease YdiL (CAAX protease family)